MVEDKEIKATVSPFAIRPGEIKVFDGKDGYVSMNQMQKPFLNMQLLFDFLLVFSLSLQLV